jgi:hypothetical protein
MNVRPHPRDPSPRVAIAIGIVALAAAIASVMPQLHRNTWIFRDGRFYVNVATTIVEDLTLDQHAFAASWYTGTLGWNRDLDPGWSNVALGARGEHWPKHPWIHPLIASPVFFAFGLPATLAWNLLLFGVAAAGLYRFARGFATPTAAAVATCTFLFGTVIVQSAYDFSVDVLMLALFAQGLAAVLGGRGVRAGILVALAVVIKPTALMLLPALALLFAERRDAKQLGRSLGAGTAVLLAYAGLNWWMYGRPWWSGYNRTLVTRGGEPVVTDHMDAFSMPFEEGFVRMWGGSYGLVHAFTVLLLALPGLVALVRRRPLHGAGAIASVTASLLVFAKYEYEGHRFHWPALAFLVPAIAVTLELGAGALRRSSSERSTPAAAIAAIAGLASCLAVLPFGATLAQRVVAGGPTAIAPFDALSAIGFAEWSAALLTIALWLSIGALLVARLVRLGERVAAPPIAAAAVAACAMLPPVRDAWIAGGALPLGLLAAAIAVERALEGRAIPAWIAAAAAAVALAGLPDRAAEPISALAFLSASLDTPTAVRMLLPWLALGVAGAAVALARDPAAALAILALACVLGIPWLGVRGGEWLAIGALVLAAPAAVAADSLARAIAERAEELDRRRAVALVAGVLVALLAIGAARRAVAAMQPFHVATEGAVRRARVYHAEVPCDFLAWEHFGWECSHFDQGLFGMVGLALTEGVQIGGETRQLLVVPTGRFGETRRVIWDPVRAGRSLAMRWAVPDGMRGDGVLEVIVDGQVRGALAIPPQPDGSVHEHAIDTSDVAGRDVALELRMRPGEGRRHQAIVAIDAVWE